MMRMSIGLACFVCSLAVHASLFTAHSEATASHVRRSPPSIVQLSLAPTQRQLPEPEPAPELAPPPVPPQHKPAPTSLAATASPESMAEPPTEPSTESQPSEAPPPDLTGTTLVSDLGDAWSAPQGNGEVRRGAIRAGLPQVTAPRRSTTGHATAPGMRRASPASATTPLSELSQKPAPPPLANALERNYPPDARRQGKAGEAKVRARIGPSGLVGLANITFETGDGFGKACQRTLLASVWTPPLDRTGRPVSTWVTYHCKFRIDD